MNYPLTLVMNIFNEWLQSGRSPRYSATATWGFSLKGANAISFQWPKLIGKMKHCHFDKLSLSSVMAALCVLLSLSTHSLNALIPRKQMHQLALRAACVSQLLRVWRCGWKTEQQFIEMNTSALMHVSNLFPRDHMLLLWLLFRTGHRNVRWTYAFSLLKWN